LIEFKNLPPVIGDTVEISLKSRARVPGTGFCVTHYYAAILVGAHHSRVARLTQRTKESLSLRICIPDRPTRPLSKPQDKHHGALRACEPARREPLTSRFLKFAVSNLCLTVCEANLPIGVIR
jgi:hypothetical protein